MKYKKTIKLIVVLFCISFSTACNVGKAPSMEKKVTNGPGLPAYDGLSAEETLKKLEKEMREGTYYVKWYKGGKDNWNDYSYEEIYLTEGNLSYMLQDSVDDEITDEPSNYEVDDDKYNYGYRKIDGIYTLEKIPSIYKDINFFDKSGPTFSFPLAESIPDTTEYVRNRVSFDRKDKKDSIELLVVYQTMTMDGNTDLIGKNTKYHVYLITIGKNGYLESEKGWWINQLEDDFATTEILPESRLVYKDYNKKTRSEVKEKFDAFMTWDGKEVNPPIEFGN